MDGVTVIMNPGFDKIDAFSVNKNKTIFDSVLETFDVWFYFVCIESRLDFFDENIYFFF